MKHLDGKLALVTGGTRGIGRATALALADAGADVVFSYQSSRQLADDLTKTLQEKGVRAQAYQADVSSIPQVEKMMKAIFAELGQVSILVNNAGITRDKSFLKMTREMWDEVIHVNLDGLFTMTQAVLAGMVAAGWGRIINVSSVVGQTGNFGQANYAATKGAAIAFTKALAREVARKGITVNAVAPGFVETDMTRSMPEVALEQVKAQTPVGRFGQPEEIAHAIVFLASPQSAFITGQVLAVNGGMYL